MVVDGSASETLPGQAERDCEQLHLLGNASGFKRSLPPPAIPYFDENLRADQALLLEGCPCASAHAHTLLLGRVTPEKSLTAPEEDVL